MVQVCSNILQRGNGPRIRQWGRCRKKEREGYDGGKGLISGEQGFDVIFFSLANPRANGTRVRVRVRVQAQRGTNTSRTRNARENVDHVSATWCSGIQWENVMSFHVTNANSSELFFLFPSIGWITIFGTSLDNHHCPNRNGLGPVDGQWIRTRKSDSCRGPDVVVLARWARDRG